MVGIKAQSKSTKHEVVIVGGGLAGLVSSILLSRSGIDVLLIEAKTYPFHRVCGEYISNEVIPFLEANDLFPHELGPSKIERLTVSAISGRSFSTMLDLGGFGISRFVFDLWLVEKARESGVTVLEHTKVTEVDYVDSQFLITTDKEGTFQSQLVLGAQGKRSKLDKSLSRDFINHRSPYVGVKYHIKADFPDDLIALHNFHGGYCGISQIEDGKHNLCYLTHRDQVKKYGNIPEFERQVMWQNPHLREILKGSEQLWEKPEVINEISFEKKEPVHNHILLAGDAAGMITPLCGNGMAMAIHGAKVLSEIIIENQSEKGFDLEKIEQEYTLAWNKLFSNRLWAGRQIQKTLFGNNLASETAIFTGKYLKSITETLISKTHGTPFS
ncbi:MAG: flavin-dependent dehydrogenase [Flavobacteriaceae bacterium]